MSRLLGETQESAEGESDFPVTTDPHPPSEPLKEAELGSGRRWVLAAGYTRAVPDIPGSVTKERQVGKENLENFSKVGCVVSGEFGVAETLVIYLLGSAFPPPPKLVTVTTTAIPAF